MIFPHNQFPRCLLLGVTVGSVVTASVHAGTSLVEIKRTLEDQIQAALKAYDKAALKQQAEELRQHPLEGWGGIATPELFLQTAEERHRDLKSLLRVVEATKADELPQTLVGLYLQSVGSMEKFELLRSYLALLGNEALGPLVSAYAGTADVERKVVILDTTGQLGLTDGLPLIRQALTEREPLVRVRALGALRQLGLKDGLVLVRQALTDHAPQARSAGIDALQALGGHEVNDEVYTLLDAEQDPALLEQLIRVLGQLGDPRWSEGLFRLVEEGRLPGNVIASWRAFSDEEMSEDAIGKHLPLLLRLLNDPSSNVRTSTADLIGHLTQHAYLAPLFSILPDLLEARYHVGATVVEYGGRVTDRRRWPDQIAWNTSSAGPVLEHIAKTLTIDDLKAWQHINHDRGMLSQLYLEALIAAQEGRAASFADRTFPFRIEVLDQAGTLQAATSLTLALGTTRQFDVVGVAPHTPTYHAQTSLTLDQEKWRLVMNGFRIDLKPYGVGLDVEVPFEGTYELKLRDVTDPHASWTWRWRIRHLE